jgi:hypothetical protein
LNDFSNQGELVCTEFRNRCVGRQSPPCRQASEATILMGPR